MSTINKDVKTIRDYCLNEIEDSKQYVRTNSMSDPRAIRESVLKEIIHVIDSMHTAEIKRVAEKYCEWRIIAKTVNGYKYKTSCHQKVSKALSTKREKCYCGLRILFVD